MLSLQIVRICLQKIAIISCFYFIIHKKVSLDEQKLFIEAKIMLSFFNLDGSFLKLVRYTKLLIVFSDTKSVEKKCPKA